jgi:hypothetical protein
MVICKGPNGKWGSESVGPVTNADCGIPSGARKTSTRCVCRHLGWVCGGGRLQPRRMAMWERNEAAQGEIGSDKGRGTGAVRSQSGRCPCQHAGAVGIDL